MTALFPLETLKRRPEFLAVKRGIKFRGSLFFIECLAHFACSTPPRVGFTVIKKMGNSVKRNRIRRRLREAVRLQPSHFFLPGHDYVIIGHKEVLSSSFKRILTELSYRLSKIPR